MISLTQWFWVALVVNFRPTWHAIDVPVQLVLKYAVTSRSSSYVCASPELVRVDVTVASLNATAPSLMPMSHAVSLDAAVPSSAAITTSVTDLNTGDASGM